MLVGRLNFFTELDSASLSHHFSDDCLAWLARMKARITMGLRDQHDARADVIQRLTQHGVPVTAWLLLPRDEGYFATYDNADAMTRRLESFLAWREAHRLDISTIGLDFEPDLREVEALSLQPVAQLFRWTNRSRDRTRHTLAQVAYRTLITSAQHRGLRVEAYQFPFIVDDRLVGGSAAQRLFSSLDVNADEEVLMLYTSLMGPFAYGLLESYAPQTRALGIGSTGGGIDNLPKLSWDALERDVQLAAAHAHAIRIFSLEGCLAQGFLPKLESMQLTNPRPATAAQRQLSRLTRTAVRMVARWW